MNAALDVNLHERTRHRLEKLLALETAATGSRQRAEDEVAGLLGATRDQINYALRKAKAYRDTFIERVYRAYVARLQTEIAALEHDLMIAQAMDAGRGDADVLETIEAGLADLRTALAAEKARIAAAAKTTGDTRGGR